MAQTGAVESRGNGRESDHWRNKQMLLILSRVVRDPKGITGLAILATLLTVAVAAPLLAPYSPVKIVTGTQLLPPSAKFPFGTDELGRDIMSRVIYGSRLSMAVGSIAVLAAALVGVTTGLLAGYFGGRLDALIMRMWDCLLAFPAVFLGIGIVAALGPGPINALIAVAIVNIPIFSRVTRAITLAEKPKEYAEAARALGASHAHILLRTILPNCTAPIIVQITIAVPTAILLEAAMSYLGLGTQPPDPAWGTMLHTAQMHLRRAPWYGLFPGLALTMLILGLNFFCDSLQDALDPRRQRKA